MAFVGLFLGGSPGALIASGQSVLNLQWQAENRQDTAGASFTVSGPGVNKTIPARADGRAEITVPVGTFTVSVTHKGAYLGDDPVTVNTESQKSYLVFFDGKVDRTAELDALDKKITDGDNALSDRIDGKLGKDETAVRAIADGNGNNFDNYAKKSDIPSVMTIKSKRITKSYNRSESRFTVSTGISSPIAWVQMEYYNDEYHSGTVTTYVSDNGSTVKIEGQHSTFSFGFTIFYV